MDSASGVIRQRVSDGRINRPDHIGQALERRQHCRSMGVSTAIGIEGRHQRRARRHKACGHRPSEILGQRVDGCTSGN